MPNWAFGYVNVTGTRDGIKSFIERFVSEDDPSTIPGKRFFARSFMERGRIPNTVYSCRFQCVRKSCREIKPASLLT